MISPQTAGGLKSGTASRAAGVGAGASRAGRREGQGLECEKPLELASGLGCHIPETCRAHSRVHSFLHLSHMHCNSSYFVPDAGNIKVNLSFLVTNIY